ncbi:conserved hypothetical protein [Verticillium alfalfae VaMs.102]|uniref:SH3 domain-containing protein n=1 Tax=Verticillium alfalfae (strain VaMs.102 / ATCC MYA-4576 / FGSC 10136) TaxID=526221 RepID=C9S6X5_VERA1|nr:conserved hypothetical protein [Verticillium alfalfae VaMs.102]EEY14586.1 conserved hypothetical protein [Verticillium alfalfae VaMs.102]
METNRSIRTIKNELENLLEKGVIDNDAYENIHSMLPAEAPLRGGGSAPARATPSQAASPAAPPPTEAMANMNINNQQQQRANPSPAPPSYANSTGGAAAAPPPGPPPPPSKPILAHARALYRYQAADSRDLSFERDDKIAVHEYMNADWWMGRNSRTGAEGIFPKTYVAVEAAPPPAQDRAASYSAPQQPGYHNQPPTQQLWPPPQQHQYAPPQPQYGQPSGPPPQQNPYNSDTPPSAIANQESAPADGQHKGRRRQGEGVRGRSLARSSAMRPSLVRVPRSVATSSTASSEGSFFFPSLSLSLALSVVLAGSSGHSRCCAL